MNQLVCQHCKKIYNASDKDSDPDFCSYSCWEAANCKEIPDVSFEKLEIA